MIATEPRAIEMGQVTRILSGLEKDGSAAEELLPVVYEELRRLAAHELAHETPGQTLQATALVHEAWLRLTRAEDRNYNGSRHFFYAAAEAMRRILVDNARRKRRVRHGGELRRIPLNESIPSPGPMPPDELLAMDEAIEGLAREDPEAARLVKLRFFAGLGHQESASIMGVTRGYADGLWSFARAWLSQELASRRADD